MPSIFIGSSSFLQVTRTTIKAWMSLNFGGISPLTAELATLEHLKKTYKLVSTLAPSFFIFFILAGNRGNYIVSDEFEIRPVPSMECGVSCPWPIEKNFYFKTIQNILITCWLSGERSLPFGLLVLITGIIAMVFMEK